MPSRRRNPPNGWDGPTFPNRLRHLRTATGLTQAQVARYLGHINPSHYGDIERGRVFPQVGILSRLLVLFSASMWDAYPEQMVSASETLSQVHRRSHPTTVHN